MRCLYCGRQLAFFRRLPGGGEFCSDAHRTAYQEEYNRLALSRLLQTGNSGEEPQPILPPPSQRLQQRPASYLDLGDLTSPPPQAVTATFAIPPLSMTTGQERDARRRADFVPWRQRGMPGVIAPSAQIVPSPPPIESESAVAAATVLEPAIRHRADQCVPFGPEPVSAQPPAMRTIEARPQDCERVPVVAAVDP